MQEPQKHNGNFQNPGSFRLSIIRFSISTLGRAKTLYMYFYINEGMYTAVRHAYFLSVGKFF